MNRCRRHDNNIVDENAMTPRSDVDFLAVCEDCDERPIFLNEDGYKYHIFNYHPLISSTTLTTSHSREESAYTSPTAYATDVTTHQKKLRSPEKASVKIRELTDVKETLKIQLREMKNYLVSLEAVHGDKNITTRITKKEIQNIERKITATNLEIEKFKEERKRAFIQSQRYTAIPQKVANVQPPSDDTTTLSGSDTNEAMEESKKLLLPGSTTDSKETDSSSFSNLMEVEKPVVSARKKPSITKINAMSSQIIEMQKDIKLLKNCKRNDNNEQKDQMKLLRRNYETAKISLDAKASEIKNSQSKITKLKDQVSKMEVDIEKLKSDSAKYREKYHVVRNKALESENKIIQLESEMDKLSSQNSNLEKKSKKHGEEIERTENQIKEYKRSVIVLKDTEKSLKVKIQTVQNELAKRNSQMRQMQKNMYTLEEKQKITVKQKDELEQNKKVLEDQVNKLQKENEAVREKEERLNTQINDLEDTRKSLLDERSELQRQIERVKKARAAERSNCNQKQEVLEKMEQQKKNLETEKMRLKREYLVLNNTVLKLKEDQKTKEEKITSIEKQLMEKQKEQLEQQSRRLASELCSRQETRVLEKSITETNEAIESSNNNIKQKIVQLDKFREENRQLKEKMEHYLAKLESCEVSNAIAVAKAEVIIEQQKEEMKRHNVTNQQQSSQIKEILTENKKLKEKLEDYKVANTRSTKAVEETKEIIERHNDQIQATVTAATREIMGRHNVEVEQRMKEVKKLEEANRFLKDKAQEYKSRLRAEEQAKLIVEKEYGNLVNEKTALIEKNRKCEARIHELITTRQIVDGEGESNRDLGGKAAEEKVQPDDAERTQTSSHQKQIDELCRRIQFLTQALHESKTAIAEREARENDMRQAQEKLRGELLKISKEKLQMEKEHTVRRRMLSKERVASVEKEQDVTSCEMPLNEEHTEVLKKDEKFDAKYAEEINRLKLIIQEKENKIKEISHQAKDVKDENSSRKVIVETPEEIDMMGEKHAEAIEKMKEKHRDAIEQLELIIQEKEKKIKEIRHQEKEMKDQNSSQKLIEENAKEIDSMEERHRDALTELEEIIKEKDMKLKEISHQLKDVKDQNCSLKAIVNKTEAIDRMEQKHAEAVGKMQERHCDAIGQLKVTIKEKDAKLKEISHQMKDVIDQNRSLKVTVENTETVARMEEKHADAIEKLQERHTEAIERLEAMIEEKDIKIKEVNQQIKDVKNENSNLKVTVENSEMEAQRLSKELKDNQKSFTQQRQEQHQKVEDDLKSYMKESQERLEEITRLKNQLADGEHFQRELEKQLDEYQQKVKQLEKSKPQESRITQAGSSKDPMVPTTRTDPKANEKEKAKCLDEIERLKAQLEESEKLKCSFKKKLEDSLGKQRMLQIQVDTSKIEETQNSEKQEERIQILKNELNQSLDKQKELEKKLNNYLQKTSTTREEPTSAKKEKETMATVEAKDSDSSFSEDCTEEWNNLKINLAKYEKQNEELKAQLTQSLDAKQRLEQQLIEIRESIDGAEKKCIQENEENKILIDKLQENLEDSQRDRHELKIELEEALGAMRTLQAKLDEERSYTDDDDDDNTDAGKGRDGIGKEIAKLKAEMAELQEENVCLEASIDAQEKEKSSLKSTIDMIEKEKTYLISNIDNIEKEKTSLKTSMDKLEKEKVSLKSSMEKLEKEKTVLNAKIIEIGKENIFMKTDLDVNKKNEQSNKLPQNTGESDTTKLKDELQKVQNDLEKTKKLLDLRKKSGEKDYRENEALKKQVTDLKKKLKLSNDKLAAKQSTENLTGSKSSSQSSDISKEENEDLKKQIADLQKQLQVEQNKQKKIPAKSVYPSHAIDSRKVADLEKELKDSKEKLAAAQKSLMEAERCNEVAKKEKNNEETTEKDVDIFQQEWNSKTDELIELTDKVLDVVHEDGDDGDDEKEMKTLQEEIQRCRTNVLDLKEKVLVHKKNNNKVITDAHPCYAELLMKNIQSLLCICRLHCKPKRNDEDVREEIEGLEQELKEKTKELEDSKKREENVRLEMVRKNNTLYEHQQQIKQLKTDMEKVSLSLSREQSLLKDMERAYDDKLDHVNKLRKEKREIEQTFEKDRGHLDLLEKKLKDANDKSLKLAEKLKVIQEQYDELMDERDKIDEYKMNEMELRKELDLEYQKTEDLARDHGQLMQKNESLELTVDRLNGQLACLQRQIQMQPDTPYDFNEPDEGDVQNNTQKLHKNTQGIDDNDENTGSSKKQDDDHGGSVHWGKAFMSYYDDVEEIEDSEQEVLRIEDKTKNDDCVECSSDESLHLRIPTQNSHFSFHKPNNNNNNKNGPMKQQEETSSDDDKSDIDFTALGKDRGYQAPRMDKPMDPLTAKLLQVYDIKEPEINNSKLDYSMDIFEFDKQKSAYDFGDGDDGDKAPPKEKNNGAITPNTTQDELKKAGKKEKKKKKKEKKEKKLKTLAPLGGYLPPLRGGPGANVIPPIGGVSSGPSKPLPPMSSIVDDHKSQEVLDLEPPPIVKKKKLGPLKNAPSKPIIPDNSMMQQEQYSTMHHQQPHPMMHQQLHPMMHQQQQHPMNPHPASIIYNPYRAGGMMYDEALMREYGYCIDMNGEDEEVEEEHYQVTEDDITAMLQGIQDIEQRRRNFEEENFYTSAY